MLSLAVDPLGHAGFVGVAWLMEHVKPLKDALDWLAGNADEVVSHAGTRANVAAFTAQSRQEYADRLRTEIAGWFGVSGDTYREHAGRQMEVLEEISKAAEGISSAVGVPVKAPTDAIGINRYGPSQQVPRIRDGGTWVIFEPQTAD